MWLVMASGWAAGAAEVIDLVRLGDRLRIVVPLASGEVLRLEHSGDVGRLQFDQPLDLQLPPSSGTALGFLSSLDLRDEGRELTFSLVPGMTAARALSGPRQYIVEIRNEAAPAAAPPIEPPRTVPEPAAGPPSLRLRTGKHPGFARLVVEGIAGSNFKLERADDTLRLVGTFRDERALSTELVDLGAPITGASPSPGAIAIALLPGTRIDQSPVRAGKLVLDLRPGKEPLAAAVATIEPAPPPLVEAPADAPATATLTPELALPPMRPVAEPPAPPAPLAPSTPMPAAAARPPRTQPLMGMARALPEDTTAVAKAMAEVAVAMPAPTEAPLVIRGRADQGVPELILAWPDATPAAVFLYGGELWVVFARSASDIDADGSALAKSLGGSIRRVRREPVADATVLRFELARPSAPSVARRREEWVVRLEEPDARPSGGGAAPRREEDRLVLRNGGSLVELDAELGGAPITVLATTDPAARMVEGYRFIDLEFLPTAQGFAWRHVADGLAAESSGDRTVIAREHGLRLGEPLLDLTATPSSTDHPPATTEQAPVAEVVPVSPPALPDSATVEVASETHGSEPVASPEPPPVTEHHETARHEEPAPTPVAPSPVAEVARAETDEHRAAPVVHDTPQVREKPPEQRLAAVTPKPPTPPVRGIGLAGLSSDNDEASRAQERELIESLPGLSGDIARQRRQEVARHLLARGKAAEALYHLGSEEPSGTGPVDASQRGLQAVAATQFGRFAAASAGLADKSLDGDAEASLWKAIAAAEQGRWDEAGKALLASGRVFTDYPQALQRRYGPLVARIAFEVGRANAGFATIDRLRGQELDDQERARLDFVDGLGRERDGQEAEARRLWEGLVQGSTPDHQVRARFALTRMALEKGSLSAAEAARQLQRQQLTWRSHPDEPEFLSLLAATQAKAGAASDALAAWKAQLQRHPTDPRNDVAADAMQALFRDVVAGKSDPPLGPLDALEVYRSYPELLPPGEEGARLLRDLARRLSLADVPKTAANLLEEAVLVRAAEESKPTIALEAAEQRLTDGDKEGAKRLLDTYPPPANAPAEVHARQARIRAALLGEIDVAAGLDPSEADDPDAVARSRIEAAWLARDWPQVVALGEAWLKQQPADKDLSDKDRSLPLRMAVAAVASGDRAALAAIDATWSKPLASTVEGRMLRLLVGSGELDAGGIEQVIAALDAKTKAVRDGLGVAKR